MGCRRPGAPSDRLPARQPGPHGVPGSAAPPARRRRYGSARARNLEGGAGCPPPHTSRPVVRASAAASVLLPAAGTPQTTSRRPTGRRSLRSGRSATGAAASPPSGTSAASTDVAFKRDRAHGSTCPPRRAADGASCSRAAHTTLLRGRASLVPGWCRVGHGCAPLRGCLARIVPLAPSPANRPASPGC
jgi:hypothetical protein